MKAIMEYNVTGSLNGKVTYYPKNNHKVPLTKTITSVLESFESKKKTYTNWEKYDYFLNNITTKVVKFETACKIMMSFRDVLKSVDEYERNIIKIIDNDRVNIVHGYNYSLANSDKRELYARYKDEVF